jgi:HlyD family secretion protein
MKKIRVSKFLLLTSMVLLLIVTWACRRGAGGDSAGKQAKPVPVKAVSVRQEKLVRWLPLTGSVAAGNAVCISATIEGPVSFCPWREGDRVEKGDKLLEIERPIYRREVEAADAALAVAKARLDDLKAGTRSEEIAQAAEMVIQLQENTSFAENDLTRIEQMVKSGSLPGEERDKARVAFVKSQTDLKAAKERLQMLRRGPTATAIAVQEALLKEAAARLEKARATEAECRIFAPFSGVISAVHVRSGDLATAKAPLLSLFDPESLVVRFSIPERHVLQVRPGTPVRLSFDAIPGGMDKAKVIRIYPELETSSRTRLAEASIPDALPASPGMFARLELAADELSAALIVPDSALLSMPDDSLVVYVLDGKVARQRQVHIAMEGSGEAALSSGVSAGELVIVRGHELLKDGSPARQVEH